MENKLHKCYGTTTIGERGQVVIPAAARKAMKLEAGDKLIVVGGGEGHPLIMVKADKLAAAITKLTEKVNFLKTLNDELRRGE